MQMCVGLISKNFSNARIAHSRVTRSPVQMCSTTGQRFFEPPERRKRLNFVDSKFANEVFFL